MPTTEPTDRALAAPPRERAVRANALLKLARNGFPYLALKRVRGIPGDGVEVGGAAAIALGELFRRACAWDEAASSYLAAARSSADLDAAVCTALAVDCGALHHGAKTRPAFLDEGVDSVSGAARIMGVARLEMIRGHARQALDQLRAITVTGSTWAHAWADLLRAEAMLEIGAVSGAAEILQKGRWRADDTLQGTEVSLRLQWLEGWTDVVRMVGVKEASPKQPRASAARFSRAAVAFPLYRAYAAALSREVELVAAANASLARQAAPPADELKSTLVNALLVSRDATLGRQLSELSAAERDAEARALLESAGMVARLRTAASPANSGGSMAISRRSISTQLQSAKGGAAGLEAVIDLSRGLLQAQRPAELFAMASEAAATAMGAERVVMLKRADDGKLEVLASVGVAATAALSGASAITSSAVEEAHRSGEVVLTQNALADARFRDQKSVVGAEIRSALCAPVRTNKRTYGFLYLDRRISARAFGAEDVDLVGLYATQLAAAWENADAFAEIGALNESLDGKVKARTVELREANDQLRATLDELTNTRLRLAEAQRDALEQEMKLAREVQERILPATGLVTCDRLRWAGHVEQASFCGGDFWVATPLQDGSVLFVIGDVTGHGMAAALITAVARAALDTVVRLADVASPRAVLEHLSSAIRGISKGQLMATAYAVRIHAASGQLWYSSAGHNPPLLRSASGATPLASGGRRLGDTDFEATTDVSLELHSGDGLLMYTDGVVDWATSTGRGYGIRKLRNLYAAQLIKSPVDVVNACFADVREATSGPPGDDVTLLAIDFGADS